MYSRFAGVVICILCDIVLFAHFDCLLFLFTFVCLVFVCLFVRLFVYYLFVCSLSSVGGILVGGLRRLHFVERT